MSVEGDKLHGEVVSLRDYFERVISDLISNVNAARKDSSEALSKASEAMEKRLDLLNEFRAQQADESRKYATVANVQRLNDQIERIVADHVARRELDDLKQGMDEGRGRRNAAGIALTVVVTLLAVMLGWILQNGLTAADVSAQVQREAPWNRDRPEIVRRLSIVENQNRVLAQRVSTLEGQVRFFCRTRTQAGLPGC